MCNARTLTTVALLAATIYTGGAAAGMWGAAAGAGGVATGATTAALAESAVGTAGYGVSSATAASGMTAAQYAGLSASLASTTISANSAFQQADVAEKVARNNAATAEAAAQSAARQGELDAQRINQQAAGLKGQQRALMAARGLDLNTGTPQQLQDQTDFFSAADSVAARSNASRQAWQFRAQGNNALGQGNATASAATGQAYGSLLSGGTQVADRWYSYNRRGP